MKRRHSLLFSLAAGAVLLSACSGATTAAVVNGTEIPDDAVTGLRTRPVEASVDGEAFRDDLTTLIVAQASLDAAEADYGLTGFDTPEARDAYLETAPAGVLETVANIEGNPALRPAAADVVVTQLMLREAVIEQFGSDPTIVERVWTDQQPQLVEVCVRHVLVPTPEAAIEVKDLIDAGDDFSEVADEFSLDESMPGGQLPCPAHPIDYVEPFSTVVASIPVGEVSDPFQTEFGWHIVIVDERTSPASYEEYTADPLRWIPSVVLLGAYSTWRDEALGKAEIRVRSQIGTWFPQGDGILPPPDSP